MESILYLVLIAVLVAALIVFLIRRARGGSLDDPEGRVRDNYYDSGPHGLFSRR